MIFSLTARNIRREAFQAVNIWTRESFSYSPKTWHLSLERPGMCVLSEHPPLTYDSSASARDLLGWSQDAVGMISSIHSLQSQPPEKQVLKFHLRS